MSEAHCEFNKNISRARHVVESAFGCVVSKFRVLASKMYLSPEKANLVVMTCVVLHNYIKRRDEDNSDDRDDDDGTHETFENVDIEGIEEEEEEASDNEAMSDYEAMSDEELQHVVVPQPAARKRITAGDRTRQLFTQYFISLPTYLLKKRTQNL